MTALRSLPVPSALGRAFAFLPLFATAALAAGSVGSTAAATPPLDTSWTQYRGSRHDGTYAAPIRTNWTELAPRRLWRRAADSALSSFTFANGRLFTQARRPRTGIGREFAIALDAATGSELWAANLDLADYPNGGVGDDDGPRSTPVIDGDRVYVFSSYLRLHCLEAATGKVVWTRDFPAELGANVIEWQNAASPVLVGDLLYVNGNGSPNRLMAIRKSDGTTAWRRHDDRMTQATPIHATVAGVPQVIFLAQSGLVSVRPDNGDLLWRYAFRYSTSTAASPVVGDDVVYCSAAYTSGSAAVRVAATANGAAATQLWNKRNENMNHWATPVHYQGHFYGLYGQSSLTLRCVNATNGLSTWRSSSIASHEVGYGSILQVDGRMLVLTEDGWIVLGEFDPANPHPIASFRALDAGKCWNSPAIADGILYVRSTTQMAAYDLAPPAPPTPLAVEPALRFSAGTARITVRTADGSPFPPARAAGLRLLATPDPALPSGDWLTLPSQASVSNGAAILEDPAAGTIPRRFYRTRE